ncbi:LOW QUALITY PROTEIN: tRNA-splicing endonuclease subunit Sen34 [Monodelphis domestica]|uniref:LOW QUALITY PROTEIN: tRNA-splicing endonuclease subunit Sen34 n=1 Tax=Monodelphis domestica TaxID=13616 RepID=UPI0024E1ED69|nr:LOW QUALITY PROTEIN: tRNA-splicing endonuclease subunit Sen34 [Monodelphis domestica]
MPRGDAAQVGKEAVLRPAKWRCRGYSVGKGAWLGCDSSPPSPGGGIGERLCLESSEGAGPEPVLRRLEERLDTWAPAGPEEPQTGAAAAAEPGPMLVVEVKAGQPLVWGAEVAQTLRERLGVGGRPVGSLARGPRQNARLGLPLLLLPEEARLLAEIGAARLVTAPRTDTRQQAQAVAAYHQELESGFREQRALAEEARRRRLEDLAQHIAEGRARKQRAPREVEQGEEGGEVGIQGASGEGPGVPLEQHSSHPLSPPSPGPQPPFPETAMLVQLPTACPRPTWARPLDWHQPSPDWPYAGDPRHELRYRVYKDLWERGYFLTSGGKFGGDFLVYPGDPLRFHAHFVAQCCTPGDPLPLPDLVSAGRLGTNVRKTLLLCSPLPDGSVAYTSLQWAGLP